MINPIKTIETTTTYLPPFIEYLPPFIEDTLEYRNYDVYVITESVKSMYRCQYSRDYYGTALHPFKAVMLQ